MPRLLLRLLGSFQVESDGKQVNSFATDKARALLAYLAVEKAHPHRRESLAALLWPDQNDERARQSLRQALSHLKQAIKSEDFLLISPQDIQIHPQASTWVDVCEVETLGGICEHHHHRNIEHCLPCLHRLRNLLLIYTGDFLAGFPYQRSEAFEEWVILTRERLHHHAMNAHNLLANLSERRGDIPTALHHVREQIRLEPWREEAHRQAMRLYALSGERSKALAQYQACSSALQNELAIAPTAETTTLYNTIQKETLPGLKTSPQPSGLPGSFIGRAREQDELAERLADPDCRLVTILGMGGMGKSRLALQVAHNHAGLYRDGIFFVPLAAVNDLPAAIAFALGQTAPDAGAHLPKFLRDKELLLVLDNFEHLVETSHILSELFATTPGLQIIITSRERLRLREEWVYLLDGLSYPPLGDQTNPRSWDSLALFEVRAAQIDPHFTINEECFADIAAICRLVEGHPLAIELAASAVAERTCHEVAESLLQTFDSLAPSLRNFPERHRSLRVVFEHSWKILTSGECSQLAGLSIFTGGFKAEAALEVVGTSTVELSNLIAKSLVRRDPWNRYSLHESIRQFAAEKLEDKTNARQRHGSYYANIAAGFNGMASKLVLDTLQEEQANLEAAWDWSLEGDASASFALLPGLALLFLQRGPLSEGEVLFRNALQRLAGDPSRKELVDTISLELARIYNAQTRHEEAIKLARTVTGTALMQARAWLTQGQVLSAQGKCEEAQPVLEKSLELGRKIGEKRIEADSLRELGNIANRMTNYDVAVPFYRQSLALAYELDDKRGESASLNNWAAVEWDLGQLEAAQTHYKEALGLYRELGNRLGEAKALNNLSNVAADMGDLGVSMQYSEQALIIHREMDNPRGHSAVLNNLGATYYSLGQYEASRNSYLQALEFHRESGNYQAESETLANLSLLDCTEGNLVSGCENAHRAIALAEKAGDKVNQANANYYLGRNHLAGGNYEAAESALYRALDLRSEIPHPGRLVEIQVELALAAHLCAKNGISLKLLGSVPDMLTDPSALAGTDEPYRIYNLVGQILEANQDSRAQSIKILGKALLKERAEKISNPSLRKSFQDANERFSIKEVRSDSTR